MPRRILCLLLALVISLSLVACQENPKPEKPTLGDNQLLDGANRLVDIPENRDQTTIASVYAVSVPFIEALGLGERVLAINVKSNFWKQADPALAAAGTVGRGAVDLEALASFHPGVLIHRSNDSKTVEAVERLGIPVLCITVEDMEDISQTLTMIERFFARENRALEVVNWMEDKFSLIDEIVATIPQEDRVSALVLGGEQGRIAADDMLQSWMVEKAGGIFLAQDTGDNRNWVNVGVEKIFTWNPQYLFITSSTPLDYTIEELLRDPAWSALEAVQKKHIYEIPAKRDSWDIPGISCVIGTMFMLYKMYPDYFTQAQLEEQISEYYYFMFAKTFDDHLLGYDLSVE